MLSITAYSQTPINIKPANTQKPIREIERLVMPAVDNSALYDAEMGARKPGRSPQFAKAFPVDITPRTHGNWETLASGKAVWRLRVYSKGAYSLNLGFEKYKMPESGQLILYSPDGQDIMGPFTPADNEEHEQLWTPILEGDELVIEVTLDNSQKDALELKLGSINHDFMNFSGSLNAQVGSCNLDVVCGTVDGHPLNDQYRDIIQSVGVYGFGGTNICSGFLINNTLNDCRPYFMTASHCNVTSTNAASVVVYWNYENSFCRQPNSAISGQVGNGRLNVFNTGGRVLANYAISDFTLIELDDEVPENAEAFYAGWDARRVAPEDTTICIHHPSANEKRISYSFSDAYFGFWSPGNNQEPSLDGDHIIVPSWDIGTTEAGSSGSPLFDKNKRVVGQLDGGAASCSFRSYDTFGAFNNSFTGGGTISSSLQPYLDPIGSGLEFIDGQDQQSCSFGITPDVLQQAVCAPGTATYNFTLSDNFTNAVNFDLESLPSGVSVSYDNNPAMAGEQVTINLNISEEAEQGAYPLTIVARSGIILVETDVILNITTDLAAQTKLLNPLNGAENLINTISFEWENIKRKEERYELQISTDSTFNTVEVKQEDLQFNTFNYEVEAGLEYFWRVRTRNVCGVSEWSATSSFSTAIINCQEQRYEGKDIVISDLETSRVEAELTIDQPGLISRVKVKNLEIEHEYIGDISCILVSPEGEEIILFDRPGVPQSTFGCPGDDVLLSFDDAAPLSAQQLEASCSNSPAVSGNFKPLTPLSNLIGQSAEGTWTLRIIDASSQDGGALKAWALEICTTFPNGVTVSTEKSFSQVCINEAVSFEVNIGDGFSAEGVMLEASGVPEEASLSFSQNPALPGSTVVVTLSGFDNTGEFPIIINVSDELFRLALPYLIQAIEAPKTADVIYPGRNQLVERSSNVFEWEASNFAENYRVEIFTDSLALDTFLVREGQQTQLMVEQPLEPGDYYWRLTAMNACGRVSSELIPFRQSTSSNNNLAKVEARIYPNPTNSQITVDLGNEIFNEVRWKIQSLNGQVLREGVAGVAGIWTINMGALTEGIYILELRHPDFSIIKKVVKQ